MSGRRIELGFEGGTVLRLTVEEGAASELTAALPGESGWRSIEAEEGTFWVNAAQMVYVRLTPGEVPGRIGFGGT